MTIAVIIGYGHCQVGEKDGITIITGTLRVIPLDKNGGNLIYQGQLLNLSKPKISVCNSSYVLIHSCL